VAVHVHIRNTKRPFWRVDSGKNYGIDAGGKHMKETVRVFKAFSDETRLRILHLLLKGELCICELMEVLQLPQSNVSRHMAYLKNAGLVDDRREAVWVYYSLAEPKTKLHTCQLKCLAECFDNYDALDRDDVRFEELKQQGTCASGARAC